MTMIDSREYAGWMNAKRADKARDKVKKKKDDIFKMKKWDSMAADPHIFVPMASIGKMDEKGSDGKKKPTHVMDIITRGQFISRTLNDKWKTGRWRVVPRLLLGHYLLCLNRYFILVHSHLRCSRIRLLNGFHAFAVLDSTRLERGMVQG